MQSPEDAILCSYYRARDEEPVTIEVLERNFPRIASSVLSSIGARLERLGWIESVSGRGHRITTAGIQRYLSDL